MDQSLPVLTTERLYMRPPIAGDGPLLFNSLRVSQKELSPWISWVSAFQNVDQAESGVRQAYADFLDSKDLRFHLFEKQSNAFIGSVGLHGIKWEVPRMEVGYWLDTRYVNKGYMTEAVQSVVHYAFSTLHVHRLEIRCDPDNSKSRAIPEKLGFQLEAILKENERRIGTPGFADTCIYTRFETDHTLPYRFTPNLKQ